MYTCINIGEILIFRLIPDSPNRKIKILPGVSHYSVVVEDRHLNYPSVPSESPLLGKCPCTTFQEVNVAASMASISQESAHVG